MQNLIKNWRGLSLKWFGVVCSVSSVRFTDCSIGICIRFILGFPFCSFRYGYTLKFQFAVRRLHSVGTCVLCIWRALRAR